MSYEFVVRLSKVLLDFNLGVGGHVAHAALELTRDLMNRPRSKSG